ALERHILIRLDPFPRVLLLQLVVVDPLKLDGDRTSRGRLKLGEKLNRLASFGPGQKQASMNLVGNSIGGENRLVLLCSFRAHQVFEISFPKYDPRSEVETLRFGIEPETAPEFPPPRFGLNRLSGFLTAGARWPISGKNEENSQSQR